MIVFDYVYVYEIFSYCVIICVCWGGADVLILYLFILLD